MHRIPFKASSYPFQELATGWAGCPPFVWCHRRNWGFLRWRGFHPFMKGKQIAILLNKDIFPLHVSNSPTSVAERGQSFLLYGYPSWVIVRSSHIYTILQGFWDVHLNLHSYTAIHPHKRECVDFHHLPTTTRDCKNVFFFPSCPWKVIKMDPKGHIWEGESRRLFPCTKLC